MLYRQCNSSAVQLLWLALTSSFNAIHLLIKKPIAMVINNMLFEFQLAQLWVCDWLLELRTSLWQEMEVEVGKPVSSNLLPGFQRDLACLRQLCQHIPVIFEKLFTLYFEN